MSDREDLAKAVYSCCWCPYDPPSTDEIVDAVISAGWRPPARRIETVGKLEALADDTLLLVVRSGGNRVYEMDGGQAWRLGYGYDDELHPDQLSVTVIWEPGND